MKTNFSSYFAQSSIALAVGVSLSLPALAEQQAALSGADVEVERITVSARGRTETLQSVPDSVTVFDADFIENARINNFRDFANLTPNLSALDNFRPGLARVTVRGLITPQVGDPPLAFVVDGVTAPDLEFINQELVDIDRIEVMRGAQGALYGRGAIGGAVIVTTQHPTEELEGKLKGAIGNGNSYELNGVISGSLNQADTAFFRIGGYTKNSDGLIDNEFLDEEADHLDEQSAFAQLQFDLFEDTSLALRGRYTTSEAGFAYYQGVTEASKEDFDIDTSQNIRNLDERDVYELSAKLSQDYELGTLDLIAAYSKSENEHFYDGDYSADPTYEEDDDGYILRAPFGTEGLFDVEATTFEARFTSFNDGALRWAVSAFYQDKERDNTINFFDDLLGDVPLKRDDFTDELIYLTIADNNSSEAWAVAGQLNYDLTDQLELTAALRYDHDARESYDPNFKDDTFADKDFSQWQPKVSVAYQYNDDLLLYTGYSKGFRSGGFNEPAEGISRVFDKEVSDSYEAGFKSTWLDNRLVVNGAVFAIDQTDAQITQFNVDTFTLENLAIDDVETQGLELEVALQATDNLDLRFSAGIVDSEIKAFDERPELEGESQVWVPEYNYSISANHEYELTSEWSLISRADVQVEGPKYYDIEMPDVESSTYTFVNAGFGVRSDDWLVQVFVDNLTDERGIEDIFLFADGVTELARQPNKPRSYGVEVSYRF
ncbi:TonB-dependent receptor [Neiella marina]|uniref:TonB-dependent receptor n=1 Tax=Neiella marina TaxID=508461 RepID=A0A8J2U4J8_9GAMM|nr:TonB-dependent receptor [Neiella marina]GGA75192.1 TonB-dependent receptor [Neiella marina]